jgi:alpha-2-macroglobulin
VENGDLVFGASGGPLYYETRLAYAPRTPKPRDEGFTLTRTLELVEGGADGVVTAGAQIRVTLTVVTPVARHDVALVDRIPAGFEPVDSSLATASQKPSEQEENLGYWEEDDGLLLEEAWSELPEYGGSEVFDHHEIDDAEVRLYARYMPPGIHTWRYLVRATTPGRYTHPPATVEEMYEPENFGRTGGGPIAIGAAPKPVATSK